MSDLSLPENESLSPSRRTDSDSDREQESSATDNSDQAVKDLPLGARIEQQQTGYTFGKQQQRIAKGDLHVQSRGKPAIKQKLKRDNKNRPTERSSKRPVPRFREVIEGGNRQSIDPRFDSLAGSYKDEAFRKRYAFLYDEQLPEEKSQLRKQMKSTKSTAKKQQLQADLSRVEQQIKTELQQRKRTAAEKASKAKEKEAVKTGKKPFFLKKSEKKKQELVRKYHELKESGQLEKAMAKRRRKNASKDHRHIPSSR